MPIFEFRCRSCGAEFEVLVRGAEAPACPACHSMGIERILSMFSVSTAERSKASLVAAKKRYQQSKVRQDQVRHQAEEVREHVQDDYGIDLAPAPPKKVPSSGC